MIRLSPLPILAMTGTVAGLAVDVAGRPDGRPPLVLLHGLTFDRRLWGPSLAELHRIDPDRRTFAVDLPGHGESPDAPSYDLSSMVERIHHVVVEAGLVDPVLVGHSASAALVAMYAARFRTGGLIEVEGAFAIAPFAALVKSLEPELRAGGFDAAWARVSGRMFRLEEVGGEVRAFVAATSRPRSEVVLGNWQDLLDRATDDLEAWVATAAAEIRRSGIPVVSVVGSEPSPLEVDWLRTNLPRASTLVWPGSGHFPPLAYPTRFAELLDSTSAWRWDDVPASGR
jgi:pimeloyl-ACP methyl ester carboxylesterase